MSKGTAISLFSGLGGDTLGLHNADYNVIAFSENMPCAIKNHILNFPTSTLIDSHNINNQQDQQSPVYTDITKIPDNIFEKYQSKIDLIFAGFPCQGFSNAGKKQSNDPRNTLFREFVRVTRTIQPKIIIGENVKGLLSRTADNGESYISIICNEFDKIGYTCFTKVLKCEQYGIPQTRERLIIVGVSKDHYPDFQMTWPPELPQTSNLINIIKFSMEGAISITKDDFDMTSIPPECIITDLNNDSDPIGDPHPYLRLKSKSRNTEYQGTVHHSLLSFGKRASPIHCEIIDIRKPSKTIICTYDHQPRLFVPLRNSKGYFLRCILPDELKQIQGFPADFKLEGTEKQKIVMIGNAVPPPLITQVVNNLQLN